MLRSTPLLATLAVAGLATHAPADDFTILVGPTKSTAYENAKSREDNKTTFAQRSMHKTLTQASGLLEGGGAHTVRVLVAKGEYYGKAKMGVWELSTVDNAEGRIMIMGGYNDDFSARDPFRNVTGLATNDARAGAILTIGKKTTLAQLVVSGFLFDGAPSNKYDVKSNSLLKSASRSYPLMSLSLLKTNHLVIDSNTFSGVSPGRPTRL